MTEQGPRTMANLIALACAPILDPSFLWEKSQSYPKRRNKKGKKAGKKGCGISR